MVSVLINQFLTAAFYMEWMESVRDPDLAGSSVGKFAIIIGMAAGFFPGDARNEAESVGGDTE